MKSEGSFSRHTVDCCDHCFFQVFAPLIISVVGTGSAKSVGEELFDLPFFLHFSIKC